MLFIDYQWDLSYGGLLFDKDLDEEKVKRLLDWQPGEYFQLVKNPEGRLVLQRITKLEQFLLDGEKSNNV